MLAKWAPQLTCCFISLSCSFRITICEACMLLTNLSSSLERELRSRNPFGLCPSSRWSACFGVQEKTAALPQSSFVYVFLLPFFSHIFFSLHATTCALNGPQLLRREKMNLQPLQCTIRVCLMGMEMPILTDSRKFDLKKHCSYFYAGTMHGFIPNTERWWFHQATKTRMPEHGYSSWMVRCVNKI